MDENDKKQFRAALASLAYNFRNKDYSDLTLQVYWTVLKEYTLDEVTEAMKQLMVKEKFWPPVATIIEYIHGAPKIQDEAELQAVTVLNAIKYQGSYRSVQFQNPITTAIIQEVYGGWISLCENIREAEQKWFIKEFANYYKQFGKAGKKSTDQLPGRVQHDQITRGCQEPDYELAQIGGKTIDIKMITAGDAEKAGG
jgi:hypothetical protein